VLLKPPRSGVSWQTGGKENRARLGALLSDAVQKLWGFYVQTLARRAWLARRHSIPHPPCQGLQMRL
jgi:hypothetical protein